MDTINARIKVKTDTTAKWNLVAGVFVPLSGEIIVYSDYKVVDGVNVAGIKVGTGNAYVGDLPFIDGDTRTALELHLANNGIHVTAEDKSFWDNKVNIDDAYEQEYHVLDDENLVFIREQIIRT